jgi:hypothetical protein
MTSRSWSSSRTLEVGPQGFTTHSSATSHRAPIVCPTQAHAPICPNAENAPFPLRPFGGRPSFFTQKAFAQIPKNLSAGLPFPPNLAPPPNTNAYPSALRGSVDGLRLRRRVVDDVRLREQDYRRTSDVISTISPRSAIMPTSSAAMERGGSAGITREFSTMRAPEFGQSRGRRRIMKNVLSVRPDERAMSRLRERARKEGKELSTVARDLIDEWLVLATMREYREGRLSLGPLASRLGLSVSEALDLLAEIGVVSPIAYDEYLEGAETARALLVRDAEGQKRRSRKSPAGRQRNRRSTKRG